jgi:DNA-binding transcriptional ArsR family regulator
MEYSKPSDVSFGTVRQMAGDLAEMADAVESELQDYAQAFCDLADALGNTRRIIRKHLGPLEMGESDFLFRFQLMLARDSEKAARKVQRDLVRVLTGLPGRRRKRRRGRDHGQP